MNPVETSQINRTFESLRLKNGPFERFLLENIRSQGIQQPLRGILRKEDGAFVLLDGFKRLRCCLKLGIVQVSAVSLGMDEPGAVLELLFQAGEKSLSILEQAAFCDHLHKHLRIGTVAIARRLQRSPAWVSVRLGILERMSPEVRQILFQGQFPARSYLYTLSHFTRVNKIPRKDTEEFIRLLAGRSLSTRDIERLAWGFFRGGGAFKHRIRAGDVAGTLKELKASRVLLEGASPDDSARRLLWDLEALYKTIGRILRGLDEKQPADDAVMKKARFLSGGILERVPALVGALKGLSL